MAAMESVSQQHFGVKLRLAQDRIGILRRERGRDGERERGRERDREKGGTNAAQRDSPKLQGENLAGYRI